MKHERFAILAFVLLAGCSGKGGSSQVESTTSEPPAPEQREVVSSDGGKQTPVKSSVQKDREQQPQTTQLPKPSGPPPSRQPKRERPGQARLTAETIAMIEKIATGEVVCDWETTKGLVLGKLVDSTPLPGPNEMMEFSGPMAFALGSQDEKVRRLAALVIGEIGNAAPSTQQKMIVFGQFLRLAFRSPFDDPIYQTQLVIARARTEMPIAPNSAGTSYREVWAYRNAPPDLKGNFVNRFMEQVDELGLRFTDPTVFQQEPGDAEQTSERGPVNQPPFDYGIVGDLAFYLGNMGLDVLPLVLRTTVEESPAKRWLAAVAICLMAQGEPAARDHSNELIPALSRLLKDNNAGVRLAATSALGYLGKESISALQIALADEEAHIRLEAARSLALIPEANSVLAGAKDTDPLVQRTIAHALNNPADPKVRRDARVTSLVKQLSSPNPLDRISAANRLARFGSGGSDAVPELTAKLKDQDILVRLAAADSLWTISNESSQLVAVLVDALTQPNPPIVSAATTTLAKIGPDAEASVPKLRQMLRGSPDVAMNAAFALSSIAPNDAEAIALLVKRLSERSEEQLGSWVANVLGRYGPAAANALKDSLKSEDALVRVRAASATWMITKDAGALQILIQSLKEKNNNILIEACMALGKIGEKADPAVDELARLLRGQGLTQDSRVFIVGQMSADALGGIGTPKAAAALVDRIKQFDKTRAEQEEQTAESEILLPYSVGPTLRGEALKALRRIDSTAADALKEPKPQPNQTP